MSQLRTGLACALVVAASLLALPAYGVVIGTDGFSYPDGAIDGQAGGTGWDWDNLNQVNTGTVSAWTNVFGSPNVSGGALVTNGSGARRAYNGPTMGVGDDANPTDERLGALRGSGVVYYSVKYTQNEVNDWSGMSSYDFGTERIFFGQLGGQGTPKFFGVDESGVGGNLTTKEVIVGHTYHLVGKVDFDNDEIALWVDPTIAQMNDPDVTRTYTGGNWSTSPRLASGQSTTWDDLVVATEWNEVLAPPPPSASLINGSFETGSEAWTTYNLTNGNPGQFVSGNWFGMDPTDGNSFWADVRSFDVNGTGEHKGVFQRVTTVPGEDYTLAADVQAYSNNQAFAYLGGQPSTSPFDNQVRIGFDPTGGTDPAAATVVWMPPNNPDGSVAGIDTGAQWQGVSLDFTASGDVATVFLDAFPKFAVPGNWSGFDNVRLTSGVLPPQPPATPGPANFAYQQTDAATGTGNLAVYSSDGILFTGAMPAAAVVQNDTTSEPVPGGVVGYITNGFASNGADTGVHLGWSGTTVLTGQIRDDLDPNTATSDPNVMNIYEVEVALKALTGEPHSYVFDTFDDNSSAGGTNDVTNSLTHAAWVGDNGGGHRQTDGDHDYGAGPDTYRAASSFNVGSSGAGDDLGILAGIRDTGPNGTLFVDQIAFFGVVEPTGAPVFVGSVPTAALSGVITNVSLTGSGLAPEGTSIETGAFDEDALAFTDRTHEWNSNPGDLTIGELGLTGLDYVRFANDDRSPADLEAVIDLEPGAKNLFLLIDDRIDDGNVFNIFNGNMFADTGANIGVDESGDGSINQVSSLYVLPNFEGTSITLGPQGQGGTNMYGFLAQPIPSTAAAVPEPSTWALLVLGAAGLLFGRRRRRSAR